MHQNYSSENSRSFGSRVNISESSLAQIVAIFTTRCDDVHAAREWILIEPVTSNEQYLRVFPAGCKVPIKMQILRHHLRSSQVARQSNRRIYVVGVQSRKEEERCDVCSRARTGNRFMWLCIELVVLHYPATSRIMYHILTSPFGHREARNDRCDY